jgi:hypothetical protein
VGRDDGGIDLWDVAAPADYSPLKPPFPSFFLPLGKRTESVGVAGPVLQGDGAHASMVVDRSGRQEAPGQRNERKTTGLPGAGDSVNCRIKVAERHAVRFFACSRPCRETARELADE